MPRRGEKSLNTTPRVGAAEVTAGQPGRAEAGWPGSVAAERLIVVAVVAEAELERGPAARERVLHVGRAVGQASGRVWPSRVSAAAQPGGVAGCAQVLSSRTPTAVGKRAVA